MGLGILEDGTKAVPGTALVDRKKGVAQDAARNHLKYDKTGKTLLVPQPSDDPNDPLVSRDLDLTQPYLTCQARSSNHVC